MLMLGLSNLYIHCHLLQKVVLGSEKYRIFNTDDCNNFYKGLTALIGAQGC